MSKSLALFFLLIFACEGFAAEDAEIIGTWRLVFV